MKIKYLFLVLIILSSSLAARKPADLPKLLTVNNAGEYFMFTVPPGHELDTTIPDNFIKIYITSTVKTLVAVEVRSQGFKREQYTIPNDVIEFTLPPEIAQPYIATGKSAEVEEQNYEGAAIMIYANSPIIVYCMPNYGKYGEGFLVLPVSSLGKEYICTSYNTDPMFSAVSGNHFPALCGIVAPYNDTKVKFTLGGNPSSITAGGLHSGQYVTIVLNKGDVFMVSSKGDYGDLAGSKITATKPVAVISGNSLNNIPAGNGPGNYSCEMELPVQTWGKYYHVSTTPWRKHPSLIRIFAKEPHTTIFRDGKQISYIKSPGGIIGEGYQEIRLTPLDQPIKPVVISGDKPIFVMQYNCGFQEDGETATEGAPFWMAQVPIEQYQKDATFFPPSTIDPPENNLHYLKLFFETDKSGDIPDDMQFGELNNGKISWTQLNHKFTGQFDSFSYNVNGKKFGIILIPLQKRGAYKIKSSRPFIAYSFGNYFSKSYGFPSFAGLRDLTKTDTLPPVPLWRLCCDGDLCCGPAIVKDMPDNDLIRSNLAQIIFHEDGSYNYEFTYNDFVPGEARTTTWDLKRIDKENNARAVISFVDRCGNDTTIEIKYCAIKLSITPNEYDFGMVKFGEEKVQTFLLKNENEDCNVNISRLEVPSSYNHYFEIISEHLPFTLAPLETKSFMVKFTAYNEGNFHDSIRVGDTSSWMPIAFIRAKTGIPVIQVGNIPNNDCDADFGKNFVNKPNIKSVRLYNKGSATLNIMSVSSLNKPCFAVKYKSKFPVQIPANGIYTFDVIFNPKSAGKFRDSIVFTSDAYSEDYVATICGEAVISDVEENITKDNYTISIYPNPVIDVGIIKLNINELPLEIYISDIFGRRIQEIDFTNSTSQNDMIYRFDASQLAQGLYFLNVSYGGRVVVRKFVIG
ncbi:MAG: hypothetical protein HW421_3312 [Ignavibacteria bacterium]|nr:hypothetical protein [Ignavibacteria bacterium]